MAEVIDVTNVGDATLFSILNALRTEHIALTELYLKEKENWSFFGNEYLNGTSYLNSQQGWLLDNQCYELGRVMEQLSEILNERRKSL